MSNIVLAEQTERFTVEQVELIKRTICRDSTDDELKLFLHVANKSKLDPFAKQIHAVKRYTKEGPVMSIQVGIDGYRLIAHRTGLCAGISDATFTYKVDVHGKTSRHIDAASVIVKKIVAGAVCEFVATAYWDEYYPGERAGYMWHQRPRGQLAKCAEALALRKAFPNELSGLYTEEEMQRADVEAEWQEEVATRPNVDYKKQGEQVERIKALMRKLCQGMTLKEKGIYMVDVLGIGQFQELKTKHNGELDQLIGKLEAFLKRGEDNENELEKRKTR